VRSNEFAPIWSKVFSKQIIKRQAADVGGARNNGEMCHWQKMPPSEAAKEITADDRTSATLR
jgi:hypothetical protein